MNDYDVTYYNYKTNEKKDHKKYAIKDAHFDTSKYRENKTRITKRIHVEL